MALPTTARSTLLVTAILLALAACGGGGGSEPRATPTEIVISPGPSASVASGASIQFSAEVRDQNGKPMSGQIVTWGSSNPSRAAINANGVATGALTGVTTITAAVGTLFSAVPVTLSVTAGAAATLTKSLDIQPTMGAGSSDFLRVVVKDAAGNNVPGAVVNFAVSGGGSTLSAASATTDVNGIAFVTLTVGATVGAVTTVSVTTGSVTPVTFTTTIGAGSATELQITSPRIVQIDEGNSTTLTLAMKDAYGNTVTNTSGVTFTSSNSGVATTTGPVVTGRLKGQSLIVASLTSNPAVRDSMLVVVAAPNGPVLMSDLTRFDLKADTIFTVVIAIDMRTSGEKLGSTNVQVTWDPAVLTYQSDAEAASLVGATVNNGGATTGTFRMSVANSSGFAGRVELRRITFRANVNTGRTGSLALTLTELNGISPAFTNLMPRTVAVSYPLRTR